MASPSLDHMYSWIEAGAFCDDSDDDDCDDSVLSTVFRDIVGKKLRDDFLAPCLPPNKPPSSCMKTASSSSGGIMVQAEISSLEHPKSQEMSCLAEPTRFFRNEKFIRLLILLAMFLGLDIVVMVGLLEISGSLTLRTG